MYNDFIAHKKIVLVSEAYNMFRKSLIFIIVCMLLIQPFTFASDTISAEQIIVAEPTTETITNDKNVYIIVNSTNTKIVDAPVWVSLVKMETALPFSEQLGEDLKVSVLKLTAAAGEIDRISASNRIYNLDALAFSDDFTEETEMINRFFDTKSKFETLNAEYKELNKKYGFDWLADNASEISKLESDVFVAYKRWSALKSQVSELRRNYLELQVQYAQYFESPVFASEMKHLSFFKEVGVLPIGAYRLRFLDANLKLIKEVQFKVVERENILPQMSPTKINTN